MSLSFLAEIAVTRWANLANGGSHSPRLSCKCDEPKSWKFRAFVLYHRISLPQFDADLPTVWRHLAVLHSALRRTSETPGSAIFELQFLFLRKCGDVDTACSQRRPAVRSVNCHFCYCINLTSHGSWRASSKSAKLSTDVAQVILKWFS